MPSLSYEPATERDIYPGTTAINDAAIRPAPSFYIKNNKLL